MRPSSRIISPAGSRSICSPDDVFWCTADPGWVTGTSYGIISPLTNGATLIVDQAEFDAERWYRILQDQKVTVWYTAPTAIRMLMKVGAEVAKRFDLSEAALDGQRRRAAQSRGRGLGRRGVRQAVPRQLVADRDRRHHDLQLSVDGREARIDGPPAAGHHRRHRRAPRRRDGARDHRTHGHGRACAAARAGHR